MLTGRKLLLVDDSVTIQKVVDLTFTDEGMRVIAMGDGQQAVESLHDIRPDIVLADIFMPGMTGYKVCEYIKQDKTFNNVPVMLLVGSFEPFDKEEARRVGADDYLIKPFQSIRQLVKKVRGLLGDTSDDQSELTAHSGLLGLGDDAAPPIQKTEGTETRKGSWNEISAPEPLTKMTEERPAGKPGDAPETPSTVSFADLNDMTAVESTFAQFGNIERKRLDSSTEQSGNDRPLSSEKSDQSDSSDALISTVPRDPASVNHAVLDLGDVDSVRKAFVHDDSILDIKFEAGTDMEVEAGAAAEASVNKSVVEEPESIGGRPSANGAHTFTAGTTGEGTREVSGIHVDIGDLSAEAVEVIARRVIEHMSEKVVREIAWEVVPQLAELLIRERLQEKDPQPKS